MKGPGWTVCHRFSTRQALSHIQSYLKYRKQRVKTYYSYSEWRNIYHGVPQGLLSVHYYLIFTLTTDVLFISVSMIRNFADDISVYASDYDKEETARKLENDTAILSNHSK